MKIAVMTLTDDMKVRVYVVVSAPGKPESFSRLGVHP